MEYEVGDIVKLKKKHPCGSFEWEILRVGADFRLKCTGCGHQIMIARKLVEKNTRDLRKKALKKGFFYVIINIRDILTARIRAAILAPIRWGARDHKEVKQHDKI